MTCTAFPTHDCPRDACQIHVTNWSEQGFEAHEFDHSRNLLQNLNARFVHSKFNRCAQPDVVRNTPIVLDERKHSIRSLREDLIDVPVGLLHHSKAFQEETVWHRLMKEI